MLRPYIKINPSEPHEMSQTYIKSLHDLEKVGHDRKTFLCLRKHEKCHCHKDRLLVTLYEQVVEEEYHIVSRG